jgi:type I restriction enzyme S subunit
MHNAYTAQKEKLIKIDALLKGIEDYVFQRLDMSPESVKEASRFVKSIKSMYRSRMDVSFHMGFHKFDPYMEHVLPVKSVATFSKETKDPSREPNVLFSYIDISSVNVKMGEISETEQIIGVNAPSRARQVVHTGDVIVSTVRPTRGAIALLSDQMDGFICSTGFAILQANDQVIPEYLHLALRLSTTLEQFGRRSAGSSYPAILENDIRETLIPVPNKQIQREIVSEATKRYAEARSLYSEADIFVAEAQKQAEKLILGMGTACEKEKQVLAPF